MAGRWLGHYEGRTYGSVGTIAVDCPSQESLWTFLVGRTSCLQVAMSAIKAAKHLFALTAVSLTKTSIFSSIPTARLLTNMWQCSLCSFDLARMSNFTSSQPPVSTPFDFQNNASSLIESLSYHAANSPSSSIRCSQVSQPA